MLFTLYLGNHFCSFSFIIYFIGSFILQYSNFFFCGYDTNLIVIIKCDVFTIICDVITFQYDVGTISLYYINKLIKIKGAKQYDGRYHMNHM